MFKVYVVLELDSLNTLEKISKVFNVPPDDYLLKNIVMAIHSECYLKDTEIHEDFRRCAEMFFGDSLYRLIYKLGPTLLDVSVPKPGVISICIPY